MQRECGWDSAPHLQCHSCLGNALPLLIQCVTPARLLLVQVGKSLCHTKRQHELEKEQEKYSVDIFGVFSGDSPSRSLIPYPVPAVLHPQLDQEQGWAQEFLWEPRQEV